MRLFGWTLCIVGSLTAVLYPPYNVLGEVQWGFLFDAIVAVMGKGWHVYERLHWPWLAGELAVINGIGLAAVLKGRSRKRRR